MPARKAAASKKAAPKREQEAAAEPTEPNAPAARTLRANVVVDGKTYGPSHPENVVTDDIAARITNPRAWA